MPGLFSAPTSGRGETPADPPESLDLVGQCLWRAGLPPDALTNRFTPECAKMIGLLLQGHTTREIGAQLGIGHEVVMPTLREEGADPQWLEGQPHNQVMERIFLPSDIRPDLDQLPGNQGRLRPEDPIALEVPPEVIARARHGGGMFAPDWREAARADREERNKIEDNAVNAARAYYGQCGYEVVSVEQCNKGWDLECMKDGNVELRVEVKGTKSADIRVELTPNEYKKSGDPDYLDSYRLAVVRNALKPNPKCAIYKKDGENWRRPDSEGGNDRDAPNSLMTERVDAAIVRGRDSNE